MQRKNNILKRSFRSGMAMIMAITIIVVMATIMALALALTSQTTKKTADLYLYEQSILLAHSAAEYSLLKIAQDGPCSHENDLHFLQNGIYNISITNRFIYTAPAPAGCTTYTTVTTPEQNGSVLMDISVSVTDPTVISEPIRYFKRSIQKL
ncbi:hypothetical protein [Sulfurimonas sp.]|uniref:hypothetical protein n=1 Tax=Sulfurimonas sp. TaxID=2022749 RepID=UPI00260A9D75|nr:hypothetical protein [Sulfurimonas sp.]